MNILLKSFLFTALLAPALTSSVHADQETEQKPKCVLTNGDHQPPAGSFSLEIDSRVVSGPGGLNGSANFARKSVDDGMCEIEKKKCGLGMRQGDAFPGEIWYGGKLT